MVLDEPSLIPASFSSDERLQAKFAWLNDYRSEIELWCGWLAITEASLDLVRRVGYCEATGAAIGPLLEPHCDSDLKRLLADELIARVEQECSKVPSGLLQSCGDPDGRQRALLRIRDAGTLRNHDAVGCCSKEATDDLCQRRSRIAVLANGQRNADTIEQLRDHSAMGSRRCDLTGRWFRPAWRRFGRVGSRALRVRDRFRSM